MNDNIFNKMITICKKILAPFGRLFPHPNKENFIENNLDEIGHPIIKKQILFGLVVIAVFIGGFFIWSIFTSLESGTVAQGKITVDTNRKTIQHLEGGIVSKIYVREGSKVKMGDPLVQLDETQSGILVDLLEGQSNELYALEARLIAERDNQKKITFPDVLTNKMNSKKVKKIVEGQKKLFKAREDAHKSSVSILQQRIKQLNNEIESLRSQVKSSETQLKLIQEELEAVKYLREKKYIDKPRMLALQREEARLKGNRDKDIALVARLQQRIGETRLQLINLEDERRKEILEELRNAQKQLAEIIEKQRSAESVLKRSLLVSPQDGTVVGLKVHTIGGVVKAGDTLMDIVPSQDKLVIEARIKPTDIDVVHVGLDAKVRLTAYKQRHSPVLDGKVINVSADSFTDQATNQSYYIARISIDPEEIKHLKNIELYPGMPAEVMIVSDKRSPLQYFITPIKDSFNRAFRED